MENVRNVVALLVIGLYRFCCDVEKRTKRRQGGFRRLALDAHDDDFLAIDIHLPILAFTERWGWGDPELDSRI